MTPGESNLQTLLSSPEPILHNDLFVFLTIPNTTEAEGTTVVVTRDCADCHGFTDYVFPCRMITISVHSSLEAAGLIAAISAKLKDVGSEDVAVQALRVLARES
ncbi:hypothetical protein BJX62DRAFT_249140 [Aspergillus germanicus]